VRRLGPPHESRPPGLWPPARESRWGFKPVPELGPAPGLSRPAFSSRLEEVGASVGASGISDTLGAPTSHTVGQHTIPAYWAVLACFCRSRELAELPSCLARLRPVHPVFDLHREETAVIEDEPSINNRFSARKTRAMPSACRCSIRKVRTRCSNSSGFATRADANGETNSVSRPRRRVITGGGSGMLLMSAIPVACLNETSSFRLAAMRSA